MICLRLVLVGLVALRFVERILTTYGWGLGVWRVAGCNQVSSGLRPTLCHEFPRGRYLFQVESRVKPSVDGWYASFERVGQRRDAGSFSV